MRTRSIARGFTLLEVLVALVIVAFGMGALMATLTSAADSVIFLRDKSFAEWVALNRISEMRLRLGTPALGKTNGVIEYAGSRWSWTQEVGKTSFGNMLRIDVSVARAEAGTTGTQPQLAMASGFFGPSLTPANGVLPDWFLVPNVPNPQQPPPPSPSPPGGSSLLNNPPSTP